MASAVNSNCVSACHVSCKGSCLDDTAGTCDECKDGWTLTEIGCEGEVYSTYYYVEMYDLDRFMMMLMFYYK